MNGRWFETIQDLEKGRETIRRRRYGMILVRRGELDSIQFRPWPKLISAAEVRWWGGWQHERGQVDECRLYYNQPLQHSNFLALAYIHTSWATPYRTFVAALRILDQVAEIKRSDALLCEVSNSRISDRLLRRQGWVRHLEQSAKRHWIKRFYGEYGATRNAESGIRNEVVAGRE